MLWEERSVHTKITTSPAVWEGHTISHAKTGTQAAQVLCVQKQHS